MKLFVGADLATLGAEWIADRMTRGQSFSVALAGGSTPRRVYQQLATLDLAWTDWNVWWSDERVVPSDDADSNERMARETLLGHVSTPDAQIHPLRSLDVDLPDRFDLVLLGIGNDGHTASLFPGDSALLETERKIVSVDRPDHRRLSLTYPVLNGSRCATFLVSGEEKREILGRVLAGDHALPAARVEAEETVVLADEAAAPS